MDAAALAESLLHTERALAGAMRQHAIRQQSKSSTTKGHAAHRSNCETTPETPSIEPKTKKNWTKVSGKFAALKTAASFAVAHGPAGTTRKHVSARVRLHQHIEKIRANPMAVAMVRKKADSHRKKAAKQRRNLRLWNEERAKIREKTLTVARRRWEDLHSCRDLNVSADQWTARKWATILSISTFVRDAGSSV